MEDISKYEKINVPGSWAEFTRKIMDHFCRDGFKVTITNDAIYHESRKEFDVNWTCVLSENDVDRGCVVQQTSNSLEKSFERACEKMLFMFLYEGRLEILSVDEYVKQKGK